MNVAVSTVMESMNELADDAQKTQYITKIIDKLDSVNKNLDDYLVTIDNLMSCNATLASNLKNQQAERFPVRPVNSNNGVAQVNKAKIRRTADHYNVTVPDGSGIPEYPYSFAGSEYDIVKRTSNCGRNCECRR